MAAPAIIDQVLRVLSIFLEPSGQGNKEVDLWLNSFQKTPAAWSIADQLLRTETLPVGVRLFAAQTIRQKVEYDLKHLDAAAQATLRDSLIDLLHQYKNDVKPIVRQICLSLADLAIQMHEWDDPVRELITKFGQDPAMVAPLLEFLLVLPEEFSNRRIQIDDDEAHGRAQHILRGTANEVLALLLYYHTHAGDNDTIQRHILDCLHSWIHSSDLEIEVLPSTPVIGLAFDALDNDNLSDVATDLICEITRRTGSVKKSGRMEVIHAIYPGLRPLRAKLNEVKDDPEAVRDLCRIFTTAGEAWADLIGTNYDAFNHVIEGLLQCAGYPDLDIAKITFMFWERLKDAVVLQVNAASKPNFIPVYTQLIDIIIHHLQYPKDLADWTAEERDEFRDFRHVMGDVLKDCVQVLGAEEALSRPYSMLCSLCTAGSDGVFDASVEWQRIEAPLFSFRAMCREVTTEVTVIPKIMEMLPQLPEHPKIKYAAILVIGRYAEWTAKHPEFISYQLNFVSQGFEDKEAVAAAAQSLKYLCRECGPHLVNHLEQLHHFYFSTIKNMGRDDAHDVTQAIAHIIAAVPLPQLAVALQKFCHPMAQRLHEITAKGKSSTEEEEVATVKEITSILNQLSTILKHGTPKPDDIDTQQHPSIAVISEIWPVLDMLITQYASVSLIDEAFARFCAYAMAAYKWHLLPVLSPIMTKVVALFNQTGEACYLWASWRCVREYGSDDKDEGKVVFGIVENLTTATFQLISNNVGKLDNIPDVIEDYFKLVSELIEQCPTLLCQSSFLPALFSCAAACLAVEHTEALFAVIGFLRDVTALASPLRAHIPTLIAEPLVLVVQQNIQDLVRRIFNGLIYSFSRDRELFFDVAGILKTVSEVAPEETRQAVQVVVHEFSDEQMGPKEKEDFLAKYASANDGFKDEQKLSTVIRDFAASFRRRNLFCCNSHLPRPLVPNRNSRSVS